MTRTVVIVQARMASTRLPGKVLLPLSGRTVLSHVLERCKAIPGIDQVCCAIPDGRDCDPVVHEAEHNGVQVCRGSENDVLDRYYQAALATQADIILRVTSDCPMIDPEVCGDVLRLRRMKSADYACNNMPASWPHGLDCEAITFPWLERAWREAHQVYEREHVTPFIRNHPDAVKIDLPGPGWHHYRWTLDHPVDLAFLQEIFLHLPPGPEGWCYKAGLDVIERYPEIITINAGLDRYEGLKKSLSAALKMIESESKGSLK